MSNQEDRLWHEQMVEEVDEMEEIINGLNEYEEKLKIIREVRARLREMDTQIMIGNEVGSDKKEILKLLKDL